MPDTGYRMTKTVLVICFFIGVSVLVLFTWNLLDKDSPGQAEVLSDSTASSRGFGQLLQPSVTVNQTVINDSDFARNKKMTELLAILEKSGQESVSDWKSRQNSNLIPSIIEGVNDLATTPQPTLGPALAALLEEEAIRNTNNQLIENSGDNPSEPYNDYNSGQSDNLTNQQYNNIAINNIGNINVNPIKTTFVLAVLGDSMVETLGPLEDLQTALISTFPAISIALMNYGQGATDMDSGLYRLTHTTIYLGKVYPPLLSYKPDILVVESFAYNPWSSEKYDLDRQWLTIAKIIDTVKSQSPTTKIILAATIAPDPFTFGDGILNWGADLKWAKAQTIKSYLDNLVNFASSQGYPLADSYHPSLSAQGIGDSRFINSADHLHPSEEGKKLFSEKIVEAIKANNLITQSANNPIKNGE